MNGRAVGFIIAEKRPYKEIGDFKIAIDPSYRGRGIGVALLETALVDLHEVGVKTVIADFLLLNSRAQALYRRCGFQIVRAYNSYRSSRSRHRGNGEFPVFNG
jgi:[ribosomal protein S18]-alanine N-acetyltransferase